MRQENRLTVLLDVELSWIETPFFTECSEYSCRHTFFPSLSGPVRQQLSDNCRDNDRGRTHTEKHVQAGTKCDKDHSQYPTEESEGDSRQEKTGADVPYPHSVCGKFAVVSRWDRRSHFRIGGVFEEQSVYYLDLRLPITSLERMLRIAEDLIRHVRVQSVHLFECLDLRLDRLLRKTDLDASAGLCHLDRRRVARLMYLWVHPSALGCPQTSLQPILGG